MYKEDTEAAALEPALLFVLLLLPKEEDACIAAAVALDDDEVMVFDDGEEDEDDAMSKGLVLFPNDDIVGRLRGASNGFVECDDEEDGIDAFIVATVPAPVPMLLVPPPDLMDGAEMDGVL